MVKTKYVGVDSLNVNYSNDSENAVVKITGLFLTNGKFINLSEKNPEVDMKAKAILFEENENVKSIKYFTEISLFKIEIVKIRNLVIPVLISFGAVIFIYFLISLNHIK